MNSNLVEQSTPTIRTCPSCYGSGLLYTECCSGAGGCSCRGGMVCVGGCNVCQGQGFVEEEQFDPSANYKYLKSTGLHFAGSGPKDGSWPDAVALNGTPMKGAR